MATNGECANPGDPFTPQGRMWRTRNMHGRRPAISPVVSVINGLSRGGRRSYGTGALSWLEGCRGVRSRSTPGLRTRELDEPEVVPRGASVADAAEQGRHAPPHLPLRLRPVPALHRAPAVPRPEQRVDLLHHLHRGRTPPH